MRIVKVTFLTTACAVLSLPAAVTREQAVAELDRTIERVAAPGAAEKLNASRQHVENLRALRRKLQGSQASKTPSFATLKAEYGKFRQSPAACMLTKADFAELDERLDGMQKALAGDADALRKMVGGRHLHAAVDLSGFEVARGDLVVVRNDSAWSRFLVDASTREKRFSHAAIVVRDGVAPKVVTVGLADGGGVAVCALEDVLSGATDLAVYRFAGNGAANVNDGIARAAEKRVGLPFDSAFELRTKDRLYCTELVRDCVNEAAGREVVGTSRKGSFEYVAADDCYRNEMAKMFDSRESSGGKESAR